MYISTKKLSDGLNRYIAPSPTSISIKYSVFCEQWLFGFAPDISYEDGHPVKSAVEFINSGVEYLKKNSWVNGKNRIQRQSWGGYQVSYLITQNDMYATTWAGAPVVKHDLSVRWNPLVNRYESSVSIREKSEQNWENTLGSSELYLENSPLFHLDKVTTPVVIMSNDKDGAVPWYQRDRNVYALRRLDKKKFGY